MTEAPAFADAKRSGRGQRIGWFACAALAVILVLQATVANRAAYAQQDRLRPWVVAVCRVLRCDVPLWHEPAAFKMLSHDVVAHPQNPDVLQIRGSFRNEASHAQAWPVLRVTLSDVNGVPIHQGDFQARDYLAGGGVPAVIGAGQRALIEMNVRDRSQRAVSFDFAFSDTAVTPAANSR